MSGTEDYEERCTTLHKLAMKLKDSDNHVEALRKYEELLDIRERISGENSSEAIAIKGEIAILCNIVSMESL